MISENRKKNRTGRKFTIRFRILPPVDFPSLYWTEQKPRREGQTKANEANFDVSPDCENIILICATVASLTQNNSQIALTLMVLSNSDQFLFVLLFTFSLMTLLSSKRDHSKRWNNWSVANAKHASFYREKRKILIWNGMI